MSETFQSLTGGELRPVNVAELEAELSALWRSAAEGPETRHAVTRSCALTLLVYVESEAAGLEVLELLGGVTPQNPCRAVIMIAQPEAAPVGLTARISAHCTLGTAGEKGVCCEQIVVSGRGEAVEGLDQVVIPLMVPGLPVYLWWRAGQFGPPKFLGPILRAADRVLVDSARFPDAESDLAGLYEAASKLSNGVIFTDLNWARLTPWRELIAQCFDSLETRSHLDLLTEVRIQYEQDSPRLLTQRAQSLLLTGWLASRLKWEPMRRQTKQGEEIRTFPFKTGERLVNVQHVPCRFQGGGAGVCFSIVMKSAGPSPATFSLLRGPDGKTGLTRVEIQGHPPRERSVRLEVADEVDLVNEEMRFAGRDGVYVEALSLVARSARL